MRVGPERAVTDNRGPSEGGGSNEESSFQRIYLRETVNNNENGESLTNKRMISHSCTSDEWSLPTHNNLFHGVLKLSKRSNFGKPSEVDSCSRYRQRVACAQQFAFLRAWVSIDAFRDIEPAWRVEERSSCGIMLNTLLVDGKVVEDEVDVEATCFSGWGREVSTFGAGFSVEDEDEWL